jgi:hypothetical protein
MYYNFLEFILSSEISLPLSSSTIVLALLDQSVMAFANVVLRARTFSQEHYDTAAKGALVDYVLYCTREY